jgi:hypothetical protein
MTQSALQAWAREIAIEGVLCLAGERLAPLERARQTAPAVVIAAEETVAVSGDEIISSAARIRPAAHDQPAAGHGKLGDQIRILTARERAGSLTQVGLARVFARRDHGDVRPRAGPRLRCGLDGSLLLKLAGQSHEPL